MMPADSAVARLVSNTAFVSKRDVIAASTLPEFQEHTSGFIVADVDLKPVYANEAAWQILRYPGSRPEPMDRATAVQQQLRVILQNSQYKNDLRPPVPFLSGRRRYVCRSFRLDAWNGSPQPKLLGLRLERPAHDAPLVPASQRFQRFHLSPRESETVLHLTRGLTTKEIAQRMDVSPNTVKQFVRLIMSKMSVTTRSGIVGKFLAS